MFEKTKEKFLRRALEDDFIEYKNRKCRAFRNVIRVCFFFHLVCGIACTAAWFALGFDYSANIAVCVGLDIVIAFFASGGEMTTKGSLVAIDIILAAAGIIYGILLSGNDRLICIVSGGAAIIGAVLGIAQMRAAYLRECLRSITSDGTEKMPVEKKMNKKNAAKVNSEMRELAKRLKDVLNGNEAAKVENVSEIQDQRN